MTCNALAEARASGKFLIFAYVIMPDHVHQVSDGQHKAARVLQFVNGIISRRVIDFLREHRYERSLNKLRHEEYRRGYKYSLWDHHPNIRLLTSETMLMQRVHYTHQNPVRAGVVERAEDYRFSSARIWDGCQLDNEPLIVDLGELALRRGQ